jgi:hypothetical protein
VLSARCRQRPSPSANRPGANARASSPGRRWACGSGPEHAVGDLESACGWRSVKRDRLGPGLAHAGAISSRLGPRASPGRDGRSESGQRDVRGMGLRRNAEPPCAHRDGTLRRHGPQESAPTVSARPAPQLERRGVEERSARLGRVALDRAPGVVIAREVDEQGGGQGSVHDKSWVSLDLSGPGTIVVDPVAVEGKGREAEEEDRVRGDAPPPRDVGWNLLAPGSWFRSPALTSSRNWCAAPPRREPIRPVDAADHRANTSVPVAPGFIVRSTSSVSRRSSSPMRIGRCQRSRSPANMRRGTVGGPRRVRQAAVGRNRPGHQE